MVSLDYESSAGKPPNSKKHEFYILLVLILTSIGLDALLFKVQIPQMNNPYAQMGITVYYLFLLVFQFVFALIALLLGIRPLMLLGLIALAMSLCGVVVAFIH